MSLPSGQSYAAGGGGSPGVSSSAWGNRADLSIGGPDPRYNLPMAEQNAPNAPTWLKNQLAGYYAAPLMSPNGVSDYGRWNWLRQPGAQPYANRPNMQTQGYQPQQPNVQQPNVQPQSYYPTQSYTPPAQQPAQTGPASIAPSQTINSQNSNNPSDWPTMAALSANPIYSQLTAQQQQIYNRLPYGFEGLATVAHTTPG